MYDINKIEKIKTGFNELDRLLVGGLNPGELMVIGGRPSIGATSLALSILKKILQGKRIPVLLLSFSMSYDEFMKRLISIISAVPLSKYHQLHLLNSKELGRLTSACAQVSSFPIYFEMPFDIDNILSIVQCFAAKILTYDKRSILVIADVNLAFPFKKRQIIPSLLKQIAVNFHVPIITTTNLNRRPEERYDKKPRLSDLRIKNLGKYADIVSLVYRDELYNACSSERGFAEIINIINKEGVTYSLKLKFDSNTASFENP